MVYTGTQSDSVALHRYGYSFSASKGHKVGFDVAGLSHHYQD